MVLSRLTPLLRAIHRVVKAYGRFLFRPNDRLIRPRANRETSALFFFAKKKIFLKKKSLVTIENFYHRISIHRCENPSGSKYTRFQRETFFFHLKEFHILARSVNVN